MDREEIKVLLASEGPAMKSLLQRAQDVKFKYLDNYVHLRGLIE